MWKLSTKMLLFLIILMSVLGGLTFSWIDWEVIETGKGIDIYREIDLPIIFLLLGFSFIVPYVKKLKEEKESD